MNGTARIVVLVATLFATSALAQKTYRPDPFPWQKKFLFSLEGGGTQSLTDYADAGHDFSFRLMGEYLFWSDWSGTFGFRVNGGSGDIAGADRDRTPERFRTTVGFVGAGLEYFYVLSPRVRPYAYAGGSVLWFSPKDEQYGYDLPGLRSGEYDTEALNANFEVGLRYYVLSNLSVNAGLGAYGNFQDFLDDVEEGGDDDLFFALNVGVTIETNLGIQFEEDWRKDLFSEDGRDADDDGLTDKLELYYGTDPYDKDTDDDGLTDYAEIIRHFTDPLDADTDDGGVDDGSEVARGTDPLDPNDDMPEPKEKDQQELDLKIGEPIVLEGVVFEFNKAEILPESEPVLNQAFLTLADNPDIEVEIHGHTDNVGNFQVNFTLSLKRAEAVKRYMANRGIDPSRMETKGFGPLYPKAPNDTPEGRQKNRRIEFVRVR